ncbi:MAG: cupin domain-containing protein [Flammeovirgaceae bacterium]|nr:cupin domain-containing protein [Flammeovirgaceae bacterium]
MNPRRIYNPIQKDYVTFLKTSRETNGATTIVDVELAPGGGVGLHYHKAYSEKFICKEGTLGVTLGKTEHLLQAGQSAVAEKNIIHRFYNNTSTVVKFSVELKPGSEGFERSLQIGYGLARDGKTNQKGIPKNLFHVSMLLDMSESKLPGAYSIFEFILKGIAKLGYTLGMKEKLKRYYLPD